MLNRAMNVPDWFKKSSVYQINPAVKGAKVGVIVSKNND